MIPLDCRGERAQLGVGLRVRHTRREATDDFQGAPISSLFGWVRDERDPDVDLAQVANFDRRLEHADHRDAFPIERERAADDRRIACELPLPELMAQHHHRLGARRVITGAEQSAESPA